MYRAWSHWRAIGGGKHLQFLLQNKLLSLAPSSVLDQIYLDTRLPRLPPAEPQTVPIADDYATQQPKPDGEEPEAPLFQKEAPKQLAEALEVPEVELELERALWQVETAIKTAKEKEKAQQKGNDEKKSQ